MADYWWKDFLDDHEHWQGLELIVRSGSTRAMEMLSGHNGRMALHVNGETLFWATMLKDHSGVWLVSNDAHPNQRVLLPAITAMVVEKAKRVIEEQRTSYWCRYFARQLMEVPTPILSPGRWLLCPMEQVKPTPPYVINQQIPFKKWRFKSPASSSHMSIPWSLHSEDFPDLQTPEKVIFVDWWWGGNKLLTRYSVDPTGGRVKWWRKKSREGALPPILVWFISGLASFVILDGHDRLQAALMENRQPQFLVLSELSEQTCTPDAVSQERILRSLAIQQEKGGINIDSIMNQFLMDWYNTCYLCASTHSRAVLGEGKIWEHEVKSYIIRHHLESYWGKILAREE